MPKILHFADAHIDIANYGRHDPQSGLPLRVIDFLKSLDAIVDAAIEERVDLVLFAGDAYKDRNPAPTFQREWGRRIMRLSKAGIPTLLLVGNHDLSPALGRAHALDAFETLDVPHVLVLERPIFLKPDQLEGLPLQVLAIPWVSRSGLMAHLGLSGVGLTEIYVQIEERLRELLNSWLEETDPDLPVILAAHASVQGAKYGAERSVMLGSDLVLSGSLVKDPRLDYVALGHIHRPQDLNPGGHPPVIYPGSIERVDFGEAGDEKYFVIAQVKRGHTEVQWRRLANIRPMVDCYYRFDSPEDVNKKIIAALPPPEQIEGAILRLILEYPRDWEALIDESWLHEYTAGCFELHLIKRPQMETRIRLPEDKTIGSLSPMELLELYWKASHNEPDDAQALKKLAESIISQV